jgi:hypothetical protein
MKLRGDILYLWYLMCVGDNTAADLWRITDELQIVDKNLYFESVKT